MSDVIPSSDPLIKCNLCGLEFHRGGHVDHTREEWLQYKQTNGLPDNFPRYTSIDPPPSTGEVPPP